MGTHDLFETSNVRYDARLQPWFWSALSPPRRIVVLMDKSGAMDEFDRFETASLTALSLIRTLGPADSAAFLAVSGGGLRVFACREGGGEGCGTPRTVAAGAGLCRIDPDTRSWLASASSRGGSGLEVGGLADWDSAFDAAALLFSGEGGQYSSGGGTCMC